MAKRSRNRKEEKESNNTKKRSDGRKMGDRKMGATGGMERTEFVAKR
jgi:hypothetical protein